jgi:hypothetical protein
MEKFSILMMILPLSTHFAIVEHSAAVEEKLDKINVADYIVLP